MVKEEGNKQKCASAHYVVHALNSGECKMGPSDYLLTGDFPLSPLFRIFAKVYLYLCTVSGRGVIKLKQNGASSFFPLECPPDCGRIPPPQRRVGSLNGLIPPPFHFHGRTGVDPPPSEKRGWGRGEE